MVVYLLRNFIHFRYEEKDSEWDALNRLVEEQNQSLAAAKVSQVNLDIDSKKSQKDLQNLEKQLETLQSKYQVFYVMLIAYRCLFFQSAISVTIEMFKLLF